MKGAHEVESGGCIAEAIGQSSESRHLWHIVGFLWNLLLQTEAHPDAYRDSPLDCFEVRIKRMCVVTAIAIRIRTILTGRLCTTKVAEYPIVIHNKEMDRAFNLKGSPFPSR